MWAIKRGLGLLLLIAVAGRAHAESPASDARIDTPLEGVWPSARGSNVDSLQRLGILGADGSPRLRSRPSGPKRASAFDGRWTALPPPSSRYGHVSIVDPKGGRLLVLTGLDGAGFPEDGVWSFDLVTRRGWTRLEIEGERPAIRQQATGIYDPVGHRVIVHGGFVGDGPGLAETWVLSLDEPVRWLRLEAGIPPAARIGHSATYDPQRHRMLLVGGYTGGIGLDVYELTLGPNPQWRYITTDGNPRPTGRFQHTTIYDPIRNSIVLHGGAAFNPGQGTWDLSNETWELSLEEPPTWREIQLSGVLPAPRRHHRAEYDPIGRRMIMVGGDPVREDDAWQLSLGTDAEWRRIPFQTEHPEPRWVVSMSYDSANRRVLMFGGLGLSRVMFNDLWALQLADVPGWSLLGAPGPPGTLWGAFVGTSVDQMLLLGDFTGPSGEHGASDAWVASLSGNMSWLRLATGHNPFRSNLRTGAVHDLRNNQLIALDGTREFMPVLTQESWALPMPMNGAISDGSVWGRVVQHRAGPAGRSRHMTIYDPENHRVVMHGGLGRFNHLDLGDMWELRLGPEPRWTQLAPWGDVPAKRFDHLGVFDGARSRFLVIGGGYAVGQSWVFAPDVWEVSLDDMPHWTRLSPEGDTPGINLIHAAAILDPGRDRVLLFGVNWEAGRNELWELALSPGLRWRRLEMDGGGPVSPFSPLLAIDRDRDRLIVYMAENGEAHEATWTEAVAAGAGGDGAMSSQVAAASDARLRFLPPNTSGVVEVEIQAMRSNEVSLEIFDVTGRRVARRSLSAAGGGTLRWRTGGLSAGVYLVRLRQGETTAFRRVVVL